MEAPPQQSMGAHLLGTGQEAGQARTLMSGFNIWTPTAPAADADYEIVGSEFSQVLEIQVRPGEVVTTEPGTMLYTSDGVSLGADLGGFGQGLKRCCCAGESMFRLHLQHDGRGNSAEKVALTPRFPAKIVPIDLRQHDGLIVNRGAFLAALGTEWRVDIQMVKGAGTCCFGGQGLFLNTLHGNGMAFLNAGGTVMTKQLQSGQGLFNTELTGPGFVMVHTMSLAKLRSAVGAAQSSGANSQGSS